MNTYACWYQGRPGYCFKHPCSGWWFVPEQGQPDNKVYRQLALQNFVFANRYGQRFEYLCRDAITPWWRRIVQAVLANARPQTVAGLLLLPVTDAPRFSG